MTMRVRTALGTALATAVVGVPLAVTMVERDITALAERVQPANRTPYPIDSPLEFLGTGRPWVWLAVAALLLVIWRRDPHRWSVPALLTGIPLPYLSHAIYRPGVAELDGAWGLIGTAPTLLVVAVTTALTVGVARLGAHLLTRPLGADVAQSQVTIPLPARDGAPELRLRHDRLVLATRPELTLPWPSITLVQAGILTHDTEWVEPRGRTLTLSAGPALRVAGAEQQWVVGVADAAVAQRLVEHRRRVRGGDAPHPPDPERWRAAARVVGQDQERQSRMWLWSLAGASPHFLLIGGSLCLVLAAVSVLTIPDPDWKPSYLLGTAFYGGFGSIALYLGLRLRSAWRLLSRWPNPPGTGYSATTDTIPGFDARSALQ